MLKKRCVHDEAGDPNTFKAFPAQVLASTVSSTALDSTLRSVQGIHQTTSYLAHPMANRTELEPRVRGSMEDPEVCDHRYRTLDPEEDLSLRPDFGGRGPFTKLAEPLDCSRTALKKVRSKINHTTSDKTRPSERSFWPEEFKRPLANAAIKALQSNSENLGNIPFTTTILQFLDRTSSYEELCKLLEREGLRIERKSLAQRLLAVVPASQLSAYLKEFPSVTRDFTNQSVDTHRWLDNDLGNHSYPEENTISFDQGPAHAQNPRTALAGEFRDGSTPRLKAPIANMVVQPLPNFKEPDDQPAKLPKPDKPQWVDREAALDELDTLHEDSTGASLEAVQGTLHEMESIIRTQKEKSKRADLGVPSVFTQPKDLDDENAELSKNLFKPRMSPCYSESDLFFPDFDHTDTASNQQHGAEAIPRFDARPTRRRAVKSNIKPPLRDEPKIYHYFGPQKDPNITAKVHTKTTLGVGHFARHEKRKEAMNEYAARRKISRHHDAFDGQVIDLNAAADEYDQVISGHPTTGGKSISDATIRRWESDSAAQAYATPTDSVTDEDELKEPESLYQYRVHLREWLADEPEVEARSTELGPWHTMAEANAVAAESVQKPSEDNATLIFRPGAWSYSFNRDENGMETHGAESVGGYIEASVSRNIAPVDPYATLPLNAFTIHRVVYLATLQRTTVPVSVEDDLFGDSMSSAATAPDLMLATPLKACTTLDLANKAAGQKWLELETKEFAADSLDDHRRARLETSLRKELRQMNENGESFDRTCFSSGERFHVWVKKVPIDGPRN